MRRRLSLAVVVWLGICLVPLALTAAQKKEGKAPAKETREPYRRFPNGRPVGWKELPISC